MRTEVPILKRCCLCLPLRYGLIVWGYIKLSFGVFLVTGISYGFARIFELNEEEKQKRLYDPFIIIVWLTLFLAILDIILTILFVIGCYKKNLKLIRIFYFYSQLLTAISAVLSIYDVSSTIGYLIYYNDDDDNFRWASHILYQILDSFVYFGYVALQMYVLLLVRSEIIKLDNGCQFRFENLGAEAECTLKMATLPGENDRENSFPNQEREIKDDNDTQIV